MQKFTFGGGWRDGNPGTPGYLGIFHFLWHALGQKLKSLGTGEREMMGEETLAAGLQETFHIGVCPMDLGSNNV